MPSSAGVDSRLLDERAQVDQNGPWRRVALAPVVEHGLSEGDGLVDRLHQAGGEPLDLRIIERDDLIR